MGVCEGTSGVHLKHAVRREQLPLWSLQCDQALRQLEPRLPFSACRATFYRVRRKNLYNFSAGSLPVRSDASSHQYLLVALRGGHRSPY